MSSANATTEFESDSLMSSPTKLVVVMAFNLDDTGDLAPAFDAVQFDGEERALRSARDLSKKHHGVIAWSREAEPNIGEYGPPTTIFQSGEVLDMD